MFDTWLSTTKMRVHTAFISTFPHDSELFRSTVTCHGATIIEDDPARQHRRFSPAENAGPWQFRQSVVGHAPNCRQIRQFYRSHRLRSAATIVFLRRQIDVNDFTTTIEFAVNVAIRRHQGLEQERDGGSRSSRHHRHGAQDAQDLGAGTASVFD